MKQVAQPVYTAVHGQGAVAGVGFSNAAGVQVDKHSKGYGYRVVGRLDSRVMLWIRPFAHQPLTLTTHWPGTLADMPCSQPSTHSFINTPVWLAQRFARHPFRQYHFGVADGGVVVYRPFCWHGFQGVSLLAVYGQDLAALLGQWGAALWQQGIRVVHVLTSPGSSVLAVLRQTAVSLRLPYSRSPTYLTAKPLSAETPVSLFDLTQWDCTGGDVL